MTGIIYCAENNINDKVYIGQTMHSLNIRKRDHMRKANDFHFSRALKKYDNWNWNIICDIEAPNNKLLKELLDIAEKMYIEQYDSFKNGYNMTKGGEGRSGYKCSEETRAKLRAANTGKVSGMKGKKASKETRAKQSVAAKGQKSWNKGKKLGPRSEATKLKISEKLKGKTNALGHIVSDELKLKLANKSRMHKHSEETKAKISKLVKGEKNPFYGKHHSEETKKKLSMAAKKQWATKKEAEG